MTAASNSPRPCPICGGEVATHYTDARGYRAVNRSVACSRDCGKILSARRSAEAMTKRAEDRKCARHDEGLWRGSWSPDVDVLALDMGDCHPCSIAAFLEPPVAGERRKFPETMPAVELLRIDVSPHAIASRHGPFAEDAR